MILINDTLGYVILSDNMKVYVIDVNMVKKISDIEDEIEIKND